MCQSSSHTPNHGANLRGLAGRQTPRHDWQFSIRIDCAAGRVSELSIIDRGEFKTIPFHQQRNNPIWNPLAYWRFLPSAVVPCPIVIGRSVSHRSGTTLDLLPAAQQATTAHPTRNGSARWHTRLTPRWTRTVNYFQFRFFSLGLFGLSCSESFGL